jgi:beta-galactosidase
VERQIALLREVGANAIRTSHDPPAPELLDLCDRMGMVVMGEAFDCWRGGKTPNDHSVAVSGNRPHSRRRGEVTGSFQYGL